MKKLILTILFLISSASIYWLIYQSFLISIWLFIGVYIAGLIGSLWYATQDRNLNDFKLISEPKGDPFSFFFIMLIINLIMLVYWPIGLSKNAIIGKKEKK